MCVKDCFRCHLRENIPEYTSPLPTYGSGDVMFINAQSSHTDLMADRPIDLHYKLINKIMVKLNRPFIYTNILRCTGKSYSKDIKTCIDWTFEDIDRLQPKLIFTLGLIPTKALLHTKEAITDLVGKTLFFSAIPCVPLFGTGYVLNHGLADYMRMESIIESACELYLA